MKQRVAFISEHASPITSFGGVDAGGQNVYVGELACNLAKRGYEVDIFTRWDNPKLPQVIQWQRGVKIVHIEAGPKAVIPKEDLLPYMAGFREQMLQYMDANHRQYKLMHAHFFMSGLVAMDIKARKNIPFVITFHALGHVRRMHQGSQDRFPPERTQIEEEIIRQADYIVAECPQDKEDLMHYYHAPENKIVTIPCGFNPNEMYPINKQVARIILKIPEKEFVLLQLGRMVPRKGVDNVIRALRHVKYTGVPLRLVIVGGETAPGQGHDPEVMRLKKLAAELGVADKITFTGKKNRDEIKYYYSAADIFITTPWYEPFGITPLEAMACGTPVIGADVGGIKYSVQDGKTGLLVAPHNPEALAEKINTLVAQPELLDQMGTNAIRRVNSLFTWQQVAVATAGIYRKIVLSRDDNAGDQERQDLLLIDQAFESLVKTTQQTQKRLRNEVREAANVMHRALANGRKILVCGNGGSAAESQHFSAELLGRFELKKRNALPVISLTADTAFITAWSNDIGFNDVFARQVNAYGQKGDVLFVISTSGNSENLILAMEAAHKRQMMVVALLGKDGGAALELAHVPVLVATDSTQRIQELQLHVIHSLCTLIERKLYGAGQKTATPDFENQEITV
ncbi:glycosyltransferase [Chitinophaga horti]|uniref:Glycosyltransferase n=1 Tax=Chitinophaga horti TaxID=2920382 RepID=A0ABY6J719_9BACT|nr:glycosyltransferase [Chitinophaga horti]UYQ94094.1 glycosyltransferase [Chitinophaga horti]